MLPDRSLLWNFYLNGLLRNINSIMAGVYGDLVQVPDANRSRGERSDDILVHILQNETLGRVVMRLLSVESRSLKQGAASLHDLALAHVILSTAQYVNRDSGYRPASTLASSMLLGEVVADLRLAYRKLAETYPDQLPSELSCEQLMAGLGDLHKSITSSLTSAIQREGRAKHLANLGDRLTISYLLGLFSLAVENGLDDRPFEAFLAQKGMQNG